MNRRTSLPLLMILLAASSPAAVLPFIEDDYGKAIELGKQKTLPLFIEAWAPW